ncbi:prefoldin subunit 5 [Methylobacterium sp. BE186]|uniref:methyltransferase domain-containing protein n=1 Tax=Methylobacterium sp. BE186 TaxID=2817715 RepID=UPI002857C787|nr:methyltransferase domain-containing protein [Methylobacterium sp. BE186]MDR7039984.1 prefoldin subunit 5 [Methylobacterium sp. BE186]
MDATEHYRRFGRAEGRFPNEVVEAQHLAAQAISRLNEQVGALASNLQDVRQHVPSLLNAIATVPALSHALAANEISNRKKHDQIDAMDRSLEEVRQHIPKLINTIDAFPALIHELNDLKKVVSQTDAALHDLRVRVSIAIERLERNTTELDQLRLTTAYIQDDCADISKSSENARRGIGELWGRLEVKRNEIFHEISSESGSAEMKNTPAACRILNEGKVKHAKLSKDIKLNLGFDFVPLNDHINVGALEIPGVDVVADIGEMPFEESSVNEIRSAHLLEHLPQERLRRLLRYWRGLLKEGGKFRAIVTDGEAMLSGVNSGTYSFDDFRMVLFGAQEYNVRSQLNMFTPESLRIILKESGFDEIVFVQKGRINGALFEFEIIATR